MSDEGLRTLPESMWAMIMRLRSLDIGTARLVEHILRRNTLKCISQVNVEEGRVRDASAKQKQCDDRVRGSKKSLILRAFVLPCFSDPLNTVHY